MQENNFEKQVQHDLDGLRMNPSENVWQKVEASLKKKKDRKVLVLLFSIVSLLIAGLLTYNLYNSGSTGKQPELTAASDPFKKEPAASLAAETQTDSSPTIAGTVLKSEIPVSVSQQKKPSSLLVLAPETSQAVNDDNTPSATLNNNNKTLLYKTAKIRRYVGAKTAVQTDVEIVESTDEAQTASLLPKQRTTFSLSGLTVNSTKQSLHLPDNFINAKDLTKQAISSTKLEAVSKKAETSGRKIGISIEAGIGSSGTANSYLGNIPNNLFYDASPLSNSSGGSGTVPDSLRSYNINPSALKPGAGFFAGILFTKKISGFSSISAGLRYQLITTSQAVGASVSSPVYNAQRLESVYKAGITNSHTNSHHLVQIPIEFNTQLSRFKQHNIFAATGISISQLVYTNALQFDNVSRQYFKNNDFFKKTSVGFSAGVFVNLRKEAKPSLLLGPSFQYSFTPLADKGLYANSHYSFLGLRLQKAFHHK